MTGQVIDGCAGPGGWDIAARSLGLEPIGFELDDAACATRRAAGLRTVQADVTKVDVRNLKPVRGLIFSPPCQAFSMAGKGAGRRALDAYRDAIRSMRHGHEIDVAALDEACGDPRAHVVLEPLRWALGVCPEWVALEQVEPVLPLWEAIAEALRVYGYMTWTGVLSAECYGVPQTRRRAILMASLVKQPRRPPATHARYVPPRVKARQDDSLFAAPEPERIVLPEDRDLEPWVSMAEALGWGADRVGFPRLADTPSNAAGDGRIELDGEEYRERDLREASEPAHTVTEKSRSWRRWHYRNGNQDHAAKRAADEPAPTVHFGHALNSEDQSVGGWSDVEGAPRNSGKAVRVTEQEAAVLQGFPADYPWQGTRTARYRQIGDAIPPQLARAVLEGLI